MIYYVAMGTDERHHLCANQAEAKDINKAFEQIDIPTDKLGLLKFVQDLLTRIDNLADQMKAAQSQEVISGDTQVQISQLPQPVEPKPASYTAQSVSIENAWEKLPLTQKLHFAALAMEDARTFVSEEALG